MCSTDCRFSRLDTSRFWTVGSRDENRTGCACALLLPVLVVGTGRRARPQCSVKEEKRNREIEREKFNHFYVRPKVAPNSLITTGLARSIYYRVLYCTRNVCGTIPLLYSLQDLHGFLSHDINMPKSETKNISLRIQSITPKLLVVGTSHQSERGESKHCLPTK